MPTSNADPLVSVILTTYDRREYLPEAIESVTDQTYEKIELVVVDDHSPESPQDIVDDASQESVRDIVFVRHEENKGASAARNTGIEVADGEILAFLDDDEQWKPTKIERQVDVLQNEGPDVGAVYTGIQMFDPSGSTIAVRDAKDEGDLTKKFLCGSTPPFPSIAVRQEIVSAAGPFDEELPSWNDREWLLRVAQECEFGAIDAPLVVSQREDGRSKLSGNFAVKKETSYPKVIDTFLPIAAEYGWLFKQKSYAHLTFDLGYAALINEHYDEARTTFATALVRWPFVPKFYLYAFIAMTGDRGYKLAQHLKRDVTNIYHRCRSTLA
ncbi:glycosyltransferase family 2 protein [Halocatena salina]|uniref:Glycosyltransferase n=1 Tax=Halocatena salina TaxID=2934340 RepID=A0A8U0A3Z2_9EURY|nr:glycosyltransferase family 2 protein [Halocatena salina]UPM43935.1 glycosyltransferase [Halocatena salina]